MAPHPGGVRETYPASPPRPPTSAPTAQRSGAVDRAPRRAGPTQSAPARRRDRTPAAAECRSGHRLHPPADPGHRGQARRPGRVVRRGSLESDRYEGGWTVADIALDVKRKVEERQKRLANQATREAVAMGE